MYPKEEIESIVITAVTINEEMAIQQADCKEIENTTAFLLDFERIECDTWWGDPLGISKDCYAIKVIYQSGEYELITWNGKAEYRKDRGFRNYRGYFLFDELAYEKLIVSYM